MINQNINKTFIKNYFGVSKKKLKKSDKEKEVNNNNVYTIKFMNS